MVMMITGMTVMVADADRDDHNDGVGERDDGDHDAGSDGGKIIVTVVMVDSSDDDISGHGAVGDN